MTASLNTLFFYYFSSEHTSNLIAFIKACTYSYHKTHHENDYSLFHHFERVEEEILVAQSFGTLRVFALKLPSKEERN